MTLSFVTRAMVLTALTVGVWLYLVRNGDALLDEDAGTGLSACEVVHVFDGRTVALSCPDEEEELTARLTGIDVPDLEDPGCAAELAHAALARDRLRDLLEGGGVKMEELGRDGEGRALVRMVIEGEPIGQRLVREGLALEPAEGALSNWCARLKAT